MMIKIAQWILLCACFLSLGCTGNLSRSEAAKLIPNNRQFSMVRTETFQIGLVNAFSADELATKQPYAALLSLEYISVQADGGASIVTLTDKGEKAAATWEKTYWMGRDAYTMKLAKRAVEEVTGISESGNTATATFTWRWEPLNDVGKAMEVGKRLYNGSAGFQKFDDGWRLSGVTADGML
jgi:hypothetical protein